MSEKRDRMQIIHDILASIQKKNGRIKPTHLLYKSNLSYNRMKKYVQELMEKEMIKEELGKNKMYLITDKGINFLNEYRRIKEFTASFGLE